MLEAAATTRAGAVDAAAASVPRPHQSPSKEIQTAELKQTLARDGEHAECVRNLTEQLRKKEIAALGDTTGVHRAHAHPTAGAERQAHELGKFFAGSQNSHDVPVGGERCGQGVDRASSRSRSSTMKRWTLNASRLEAEERVRRAKNKWNFEDSATELSLRRGTVSAIDASLISAVLLSPALALVKLDLRTSQMGAHEVASTRVVVWRRTTRSRS